MSTGVSHLSGLRSDLHRQQSPEASEESRITWPSGVAQEGERLASCLRRHRRPVRVHLRRACPDPRGRVRTREGRDFGKTSGDPLAVSIAANGRLCLSLSIFSQLKLIYFDTGASLSDILIVIYYLYQHKTNKRVLRGIFILMNMSRFSEPEFSGLQHLQLHSDINKHVQKKKRLKAPDLIWFRIH